jgi:sulfopyruvate decarboxylase TPP-binding subunit
MKTDLQTHATVWPDQIFDVLKETGVTQVAYVPDAGHSKLIKRCEAEKSMHTVSLTTEEEGVAMLAGSWMGGVCGVLLMQSSGVGNCINMLSMFQECRLPLLMLVTMRGVWGEFNPWQVPMGGSADRRRRHRAFRRTRRRYPRHRARLCLARVSNQSSGCRADPATRDRFQELE